MTETLSTAPSRASSVTLDSFGTFNHGYRYDVATNMSSVWAERVTDFDFDRIVHIELLQVTSPPVRFRITPGKQSSASPPVGIDA